MPRAPKIIPISDLRQNASNLVRGVSSSREPVFITQRGKAAAVMVSMSVYERLQHELELLHLLAGGEKEIAANVETVIEMQFSDSPGCVYGEDFTIGDIVTVDAGIYGKYDIEVVSAEINYTANKRDIIIVLGSESTNIVRMSFNPYFTGCFSFRAADFSLIFDRGTETSPISPPCFFLEKYFLLYKDKKSYTNFPIGAVITPIRNYSFFWVITFLNNTQNTLYDFCQ